MYKKFEINRTKIKGGCQSGTKVITHDSKSDLPLELAFKLAHAKKKPPNPKFFTWEICTLFFAHFPCANSLCIPSALEKSFFLIKTGELHSLGRISSIRKFTMRVYDNSMPVVKQLYRTENILKNDVILMARHLKIE